jgi:hypothetical protein
MTEKKKPQVLLRAIGDGWKESIERDMSGPNPPYYTWKIEDGYCKGSFPVDEDFVAAEFLAQGKEWRRND